MFRVPLSLISAFAKSLLKKKKKSFTTLKKSKLEP